ncbi:hypothetical protein ART_3870 [Arthrobacter sp. PAMC 25486]|nr:hypothetical protein ART_3870 [Arthrobacter sp. PAMC 25486]
MFLARHFPPPVAPSAKEAVRTRYGGAGARGHSRGVDVVCALLGFGGPQGLGSV